MFGRENLFDSVIGWKWSSGEIAAVGPTSFQFIVPEGVPLTVSPAVGTVLPGQVSYGFTFTADFVQCIVHNFAV